MAQHKIVKVLKTRCGFIFAITCHSEFHVWPETTLFQCGPEMPKGWTPCQ